MINKIYALSDNDFINLIKSSLNISEVLFKLGYSINGNSWGFNLIKQRMQDLNLSCFDFKGKKQTKKQRSEKVNPNKLFSINSKHTRHRLREYIIKHNILPYKCAICGIKEWNGKTLSLEIDHINGINNDNRIENLRFLCPNCHSQTSTYGAKNEMPVINDIMKNKIIKHYTINKNAMKTAKELKIPYKIIKKTLSTEGILKLNQKYVIQYDLNNNEIKRFGSITECCNWLIEMKLVNTKNVKSCKKLLSNNINKPWNGFYYKFANFGDIRNNP